MTVTLSLAAALVLHLDPILPAPQIASAWLADASTSSAAPKSLTSDETLIRQSFDRYKTALLKRQGAIATHQVSNSTLAYYGKMRDLALRGSERTVRSLSSLSDQYLVLALRHRVGLKALLPMSDKDVVSLAVREGWIGENGLAEINLGTISVQDRRAEAVLVIKGTPYPEAPRFIFLKEQTGWKLDLTAILPVAETFIQQWYLEDNASAAISKDAFLMKILGLVSESKVPETIWQPLQLQ
jgi:hypothetical protein